MPPSPCRFASKPIFNFVDPRKRGFRPSPSLHPSLVSICWPETISKILSMTEVLQPPPEFSQPLVRVFSSPRAQRFRYVSIHSYTLSAGLRKPNRCERIKESGQIEIDGVCRIHCSCLMLRESQGGNSRTAAEAEQVEDRVTRRISNGRGESARTTLSKRKRSGFAFRRAPMKSDLASSDATTRPRYRKCIARASKRPPRMQMKGAADEIAATLSNWYSANPSRWI
jgi:hypothetical protein